MSDLQAQLEEAGNMITVPASWGTFDEFHAKLALLRKHDPVHLVNAPDHYPFWLLTKNADIFEIEAKSNIFLNEPRPILANAEADDHTRNNGNMLRTLIHMDDPDHAEYRKVAADWFLPKNLARLDARMSELAKQSVDKMVDLGGKCDFSRDIALQYPLQVILAILGLPETDYQRMLMLTQEMFGNADPDLQRGTTIEDLTQVINDFFIYFSELSASRKSTPTNDLASTIANGEVYDKPLGDVEMISYYIITATAGHDTTSAAIAGGMLSLLQNPDQLKRLQDDMSLLPTAVDEMIRWALHAHRHRGLPAARPDDPGRAVGSALVPLGQPRRGGLRGPLRVRRRSFAQQTPGLRIRGALLPRRDARPNGVEGLLQGTASAPEEHRDGRRAEVDEDDLRWWSEVVAGSVRSGLSRSVLSAEPATRARRVARRAPNR